MIKAVAAKTFRCHFVDWCGKCAVDVRRYLMRPVIRLGTELLETQTTRTATAVILSHGSKKGVR